MEQKRQQFSDEIAYLKSQSMRNNLILTGIEEDNSQGNESQVVTERKLREHLSEKLKIPNETVEGLRFERVHRTPYNQYAVRFNLLMHSLRFSKTAS
ncbi:hypothetical protein DPMN_113464 [Dreissena polymorpha]|uniref:Uncharacterized protein n=1 Tax=Dreissena polymorpha TaxID=45954 RepID=A0A9D4KHH5_DREPO|nr:hypothetical protein DPMN_113464 [Dreissena polymorpha]